MPATKFVPEVPHAQLEFRNLALSDADLLPGDGYASYVKPFRTIEDIHVQAAVLSYLMREGQRLSWPQDWLQRLPPLLTPLGKNSDQPPPPPPTPHSLSRPPAPCPRPV